MSLFLANQIKLFSLSYNTVKTDPAKRQSTAFLVIVLDMNTAGTCIHVNNSVQNMICENTALSVIVTRQTNLHEVTPSEEAIVIV